MKKIVALLVVASLSLTAVACYPFGSIVGRGDVETRNFDFTGFTKVEISTTFNVEIVRDNTFSVSVTTNQNIFDYLALEKNGDTLKIKLKSGNYTVASLRAKVTMPDVSSLDASGASSGTVNGFTLTHALVLKASGASNIELVSVKTGDVDVEISGASRVKGSLDSGNATINLSGASNINLSGRGQALNVTSSGASRATLRDFATASVKVNFSGASSGDVNTSGRLDATLSGASSLKYFGNPALGDINVTGASSINKG